MRVRVPVLAALVAAALPTLSIAQVAPPITPHRQGFAQGHADGAAAGREDGDEIGRSQALVESYLHGFRDGVHAADRSRDVQEHERDADEEGWEEGRRSGAGAGLAAGQQRGEDAASSAFARLDGRPSFRSEAPPVSRDVPPPPAFDACEAPALVKLWLPRGTTYELDPATADSAERRQDLGVPNSPYPERSLLRQEARRLGWASGDDLDDWVDGYHEGFDDSYEDVFLEVRSSVAWSVLRRSEDDGLHAGRTEGERRLTCAAFGRGHRRGFDDGFDEGFEQGFREGWAAAAERHETGPVILVQSARLIDGNGDSVFEPGEEARVELVVANAGLIDATADVLSWKGVQSLDTSGQIETPLAAQSRRVERLSLGSIGRGAPLGATAIVALSPWRGTQESLSTTVGRPVLLDDVIVFLDVRDDRLVRVQRAMLRSVATTRVDRELRVTATGGSEIAPQLEAGATGDVAIVVPTTPEDLDATLDAEMRLEGPDGFWMLRRASASTPMERATELSARLAPGSTEQRDARAILSRRLNREFDAALVEPKLYKRLDRDSELMRFATALASRPADQARLLRAEVAAPLLARARLKGTPRKIRSAVQDALDPR